MSNSNSSQSIEAPSLREFYSDVEANPDVDMDSLHVLPLSIVPFTTSGLKRARMIKNVQLDSVIELFNDNSSGSGQIEVSKIGTVFDLSEEKGSIDKTIIEQLSKINSYDIYTLRINLRKISIPVDQTDNLKLSEGKNKELVKYMTEFTRPLIKNIYGKQEKEISSVNQLIEMFKNPDQELALKNLRELADGLQMDLIEIPNFLEDYGDIFLSLAYFQECAEKIIPNVEVFINEMEKLKTNEQLKFDRNIVKTCEYMDTNLNYITGNLTNRFDNFQKQSEVMWNDITPDSFRRVKDMIASHHSTLGGVLCGLAVKMARWQEKFADGRGGPMQRAEFLISEMRQGIEKITDIEKSAPDFSQMHP